MYGKKIIAAVAMISVVTLSAAMFAAFEAHVINVTAKIENALAVNTTPIEFGTVFPEEVLYSSPINMKLSDSFMAEDRVDDVEYIIRQKPKCALFDKDGNITDYGRVTEDGSGNFICVDANYTKLPVLCPFLSKTPDNSPDNDGSIAAFHGSITDWTMADTLATQVLGRLAKSDNDVEDNWIIDLHVPCFAGNCAQDYVVPEEYELDPALEHLQFGCDLWIEVTGISETDDDLGCLDKADVMLVLDRSGSIDSSELAILKTAAKDFVTALAPAVDKAYMGQTSFAYVGSHDLALTYDITAINAAIDGLISDGRTNLAEGITLATAELTGVNDRADADAPDFMVIITDGAPNEPGDETAAKAAAATAANFARAEGIKLYVVGVGTDTATADYLRNSIANSVGQYYDVTDYSGLSAILDDIATCNP